MKALLAGGAGFLGSHLAEKLISEGYSLDILDNFASGLESNIETIENKVNVINQDVTAFKTSSTYDLVLNFASRASRVEWETKPVEVALSNALGCKNLIELSLKSNALYIYASSSEVYGNASVVPTPEDYLGAVSTTGTRSPYDEGKRFGDALTKAYERQYGLRNIILRFFNTYGPRMRGGDFYGRVVDRFVNQALNQKPLTIYGDGKQTRAFTYVTDTVRGIMTTIEKGQEGEVYNIGNDKQTMISRLAEIVLELSSSKSEIVYKPLPENDPSSRAANIDKMKSIGWKPTISLEEGVLETIESKGISSE